MGLLDQVLGQVIGGMMGGSGSGGGGGRPGPSSREPASSGGGLGDILSQLGGQGGKYSPLVLALLALLASKHLSTGAGGYGTILHDMLGKLGGGGAAPELPEPQEADEPPPPPRRGRKGGSGGFMDEIGSMLDKPGGDAAPAPAPAGRGRSAPRGGGLDDLLQDFIRNGQGDTMRSWMSAGPNQPISPDALDRALGSQTVDDLARATGSDRGELLRQLSQALPEVVDRLTPDGRLPSRDEQARWL